MIKNQKLKKPNNTLTRHITSAKSLSRFSPQSVIYYPRIRFKRKNTKLKHNNNKTHKIWHTQDFRLQRPLLLAPLWAPQTDLLYYYNSPNFSTAPINFSNVTKIGAQIYHKRFTLYLQATNPPQNFIIFLQSSSSEDHSMSIFLAAIHSQIAKNVFNTPQGPDSIIERPLSQAQWKHSFNIVKYSSFFKRSSPFNFHKTPHMITLRSLFHQCIDKQPDTTRTYPTLPLKIDPNLAVPEVIKHYSSTKKERAHDMQNNL